MHPSITIERVMELAESEMFGTDNPGLCLSCGEETDGCEPDARNYECPNCGKRRVYGASEVLLMIA